MGSPFRYATSSNVCNGSKADIGRCLFGVLTSRTLENFGGYPLLKLGHCPDLMSAKRATDDRVILSTVRQIEAVPVAFGAVEFDTHVARHTRIPERLRMKTGSNAMNDAESEAAKQSRMSAIGGKRTLAASRSDCILFSAS